jgi:hypothetical protein
MSLTGWTAAQATVELGAGRTSPVAGVVTPGATPEGTVVSVTSVVSVESVVVELGARAVVVVVDVVSWCSLDRPMPMATTTVTSTAAPAMSHVRGRTARTPPATTSPSVPLGEAAGAVALSGSKTIRPVRAPHHGQ